MRYILTVTGCLILIVIGEVAGFILPSRCPLDNDASFCEAIARGEINVLFWGDSITEGISQVAYHESWAGRTEEYLRERLPDSYINAQNISIAGQSIYAALDPSYLVDAPSGQTSWIDIAVGSRADLVFIAFGMNTQEESPLGYGAALQQIISRLTALPVPPTIVLVTPVPPVDAEWSKASPRDWVLNTANEARFVAANNSLPVVDAAAFMEHALAAGLTNEDIFGVLGGADGNGMNHPTAFGHNEVYFLPVVQFLEAKIVEAEPHGLGAALKRVYRRVSFQ